MKLRAQVVTLPISNLTSDFPGGVLRYIFLAESMLLPFTDEHQPSKIARAAKTAAKDLVSPSALGSMSAGRGMPHARRCRGRSTRGASDDAYIVYHQPQVPTIQKILQRKNFPWENKMRLR